MKSFLFLFILIFLYGCASADYTTKKVKSAATISENTEKSESGLKAGFADDNKQFNYFLKFLEKYNHTSHYPMDISERIQIIVKDQSGNTIPNARVSVTSDTVNISEGKTYSDGSYFFYPSVHKTQASTYKVSCEYNQVQKEVNISRYGERRIDIILNREQNAVKQVPLDIVFILDTTGSMGEEINRLLTTIDIIHLNLTSNNPGLIVRFGLVLYRDKEDSYITKTIPLTDNIEKFQGELKKVKADGGGDTPEDLQSALKDAIQKIIWNEGIRLGFIITDAPPHLDYNQEYTYVNAAEDAKENAVKLFSIGTGGLDLMGEYILRQISQYTYAKYIFLTYGEKGESEGGKTGSVSHHTGSNYETNKLEAIIIHFTKEEIAAWLNRPIEYDEDYFLAQNVQSVKKEETLKKLFKMALSQLTDYSTIELSDKLILGVLPITSGEDTMKTNAEYFSEYLTVAASENNLFKLTERKDLQKITEELGLQMSGLTEKKNTVEIGKIMGADILLIGNMYSKNQNYEIFLKLLRVETGEVLAVTKLKIDKKLGLNI